MYKPKFKSGDIIRPKTDAIMFYPDYKDGVKISKIIKLNNTFYYKIFNDMCPDAKDFETPIVSAMDIDKYYELDNIYLRKDKIKKIIYNRKVKQDIENEEITKNNSIFDHIPIAKRMCNIIRK